MATEICTILVANVFFVSDVIYYRLLSQLISFNPLTLKIRVFRFHNFFFFLVIFEFYLF
ncbi:hypothetical protein DFH28DRAFT_974143 [Melampsora americana]|nr:hypothetical protein DFH28DRAFT_974143 [Melampsora americana]